MDSDRRPETISIGEYGAEVLPDLYIVSWLGMCPPRIDCHVYALRGKGGVVLIDCGTPWGHERIVRNLQHWGIAVQEVRAVFCTHAHVDHVSGGYLFKARGAEMLGHKAIFTPVEMQWESQGALAADGAAYRFDTALSDGETLERCGLRIEVLHTPGHTAGCLSFRIARGEEVCLFTGDLIMSNGLPGWSGDSTHDRQALVASLKRLRQVAFDHLCHGHDAIRYDRGALFRQALENERHGKWPLAQR
ncbi:MAG: MBL fold metallo-hydrolase [Planctomycetota bacterium]|nr:MBL fold metallo-hydrolase [Planctomycetota bacterium]